MYLLYEKITFLFDPLHYFWEHERIHRKIAIGLVVFFLFSLLVIEMKRQGWIPAPLQSMIPSNHFDAVHAAFTVVLILEVVSLVFTLPCSFSRSVGKQFEILSLILIRNAFKALAQFPEPISFAGNQQAVLHIVSDGFGALLIFGLLGYYYLMQGRASEEAMKPSDLFSFVSAKKGIALILLAIFIFLGGRNIWLWAMQRERTDFLYDFYTILILSDILIVLISEIYQPSFYTVFRNSGFALSTMLIRMALAAPPYFNILIGGAAALFAILLTKTSSRLFKENPATHRGTTPHDCGVSGK
jgi:hypothetical protein